MQAIHDCGMVHQDLKPENIFLLSRDDDPDTVKILDFGIVRILEPISAMPLNADTQRGFGTPEYLAPEQIQGNLVDERTDQYAFGCILYEMLTGDPPFVAEDEGIILSAHIHDLPNFSRLSGNSTQKQLRRLTERLLAKEPNLRYPTMRDVAAELTQAEHSLEEPDGVQPANSDLAYPAGWRWGLAVLCLGVVLGGVLLASHYMRSAAPSPQLDPLESPVVSASATVTPSANSSGKLLQSQTHSQPPVPPVMPKPTQPTGRSGGNQRTVSEPTPQKRQRPTPSPLAENRPIRRLIPRTGTAGSTASEGATQSGLNPTAVGPPTKLPVRFVVRSPQEAGLTLLCGGPPVKCAARCELEVPVGSVCRAHALGYEDHIYPYSELMRLPRSELGYAVQVIELRPLR
jgi:serine/threonine-protein kinase